MITLSRIFIYPIKSTAPIEIDTAQALPEGLAHDRRYVVTDDKGRFLTARRFPRMILIHSAIRDGGLLVTAPDMPALNLETRGFEQDYGPIKIWNDTVSSQRCGAKADAWFSQYLGIRARLYYMGEKSRRPCRDGGVVSFADGAPLLLLSENSVADLNTRLETAVELRNFRPNLVVSGCAAYAEDSWSDFKIGAVGFSSLWRCARCVLTTIHPDTAELHPQRQPLATLMEYRRGDDDAAYFGRNVSVQNNGFIHTGQTLDISANRHSD